MQKRNKKVRFNVSKQVLLAVVFFFSLIGIFAFSRNFTHIKNVTVDAFSAKPETFTELYFNDPIGLPRFIEDQQQYGFSFTVHNLEGKATPYTYAVSIQTDSQKVVLDTGRFYLQSSQSKSVNENFGPLKPQQLQVIVELVGKDQQISFWMQPSK